MIIALTGNHYLANQIFDPQMKKKLLIVSHALELGGAERSLIGLLNAFDFEKYDVDLFLLRHEGGLIK